MNARRRTACVLLLVSLWGVPAALPQEAAPPPLPGGPAGEPARPYAYPVHIPPGLRAKNYNSHCVWCCLQTVARHQNVVPLVDVLKEVDAEPGVAENGAAWFDDVHARLVAKKVAHYYQPRGTFATGELQKALRKGVGVIVSLDNAGKDYSHAVVLAGYWRDWASYYDPDDPSRVWDVPRAEFDRRWNGTALFLNYLVPRRTPPAPGRPGGRLLVRDVLAAETTK